MKSYSHIGIRATFAAVFIAAFWLSAPLLSASIVSLEYCYPGGNETTGCVPPLDHFKCYGRSGKPVNVGVQLKDQFDTAPVPATVAQASHFCNPTLKFHGYYGPESGFYGYGLNNPDGHLNWYAIKTNPVATRTVQVWNQFGFQTLQLGQPRWLAVPTEKDDDCDWILCEEYEHQDSPVLDHYKCYVASGNPVDPYNSWVTLLDEFEIDVNFQVLKPLRFCNPVEKIHNNEWTGIVNERDHLVCYDVAKPVSTRNQFGGEEFLIRKNMDLCVPSAKFEDGPPV